MSVKFSFQHNTLVFCDTVWYHIIHLFLQCNVQSHTSTEEPYIKRSTVHGLRLVTLDLFSHMQIARQPSLCTVQCHCTETCWNEQKSTVQFSTVLYSSVLSSTVLSLGGNSLDWGGYKQATSSPCIWSRYIVNFGTVQCCSSYILLYCTVLFCIVLYCTVLVCTVVHCTIVYCTVM